MPATLIFDGDCGFCTTSARWAQRRFRHGEQAQAWQLLEDGVLAGAGLSEHDVQEAAWWVDGDGVRERGHRAVGRALVAGGGWRRVAGLLALTPPVSWLAAGVYRLVVRWRYRLPGGTPACRVRDDG
jgi:predicted DCC family thiol-disulfide oxidoreductase YuxK